jgi:phosphoribosylanthranilate isomerase
MQLPDRPLVKLDGFRELEHAQAASDAGADMVGFIFAPSKRQVTADIVRSIVDALEGPSVPVGVFFDEPADEINAVARDAGVKLVQLHWRLNVRDLLKLEMPYFLVRRTEPGATFDEIAPALDRVLAGARPPVRIVVDSYHPGQGGGTGALADWDLARQLAASFPVMLAGGLNPENVAHAIEQVRPVGVDVSSGVEIDGHKSPMLIEAFVRNARSAFSRYSASSESSDHA